MKVLTIGLATLAVVGLVWWLARPSADSRPRRELEPATQELADGASPSTTKVPAGTVGPTRVPKTLPEADPADASLTVALLAVEGPSSQAKTVASVELEVGVGREPSTLVSPIEAPRTLARVVTDADGNAATRLGRSALARAEVVWARVVSPGYQQITAWKLVPGEEHLSLQVVAREGGTIRGVVKDAAGEGVRGARVTLLAQSQEEKSLALDEVASGPEGGFELHFAWIALPCDVQAAAREVGSGSVRDLDLGGPPAPQGLVVVLSGPGVLAGVVRDPSGLPIAAYPLHVVPADLGRLPAPRDHHRNEWSGGLYADELRTDAEGRFRSAGLKPGAYVLLGSTKPAHPPEPLHDEPFVTDDIDIDLVVERHRLELAVLDAGGARVELDPYALHRPELPLGGTRVYLQECDAEGIPLEPREFVTSPPDVAQDGTVVFTVLPDRHYLAGAVDRRRFASAVTFIPPTRYLVRQELRFSPEREAAELRVSVLRPDGQRHVGSLQVYVHEAESGRLVTRSRPAFLLETWDGGRLQEPPPAWTAAVPPGRYVVRAEAEPMPTHVLTSAVAKFSPDEETVELLSGQTTDVELRLRGSGRLELRLDVPAAGPDPAFWEREDVRSYWLLGERFQAVFREALEGRSAELVSAAGDPPLRPRFRMPLPAESPLPRLDARWIYPQATAITLTPLAPGEYRLRVEGLPERSVTIRDGETTSVTLP